ncbi:MAG: diaminopimelate epimerase [Deltaproteobacteria bacterium]|nr:diaminopimelate epimerase [Deltaproteobacteria bacterium]
MGLPHRIPFMKMTGSGNDFILVDNRNGLLDLESVGRIVPMACRRKLSAGADGFILIEDDPEVDFSWRFYNADGSEAEMCGNGSRCAARFAILKGIATGPRLSFRTLAGIVQAEVRGRRVKVRMPPPHGLETDIRLDRDGRPFSLDFINTGVPHVVQLLEDKLALEAANVFEWGRWLRHHPRFHPAGTNVNFAHVFDSHHMAIRTYERGVEAETLACGTGSIAAALVAAARKLVTSPVEVLTRSGETLTIHFKDPPPLGQAASTSVFMEGEARVAYEAELWDETLET